MKSIKDFTMAIENAAMQMKNNKLGTDWLIDKCQEFREHARKNNCIENFDAAIPKAKIEVQKILVAFTSIKIEEKSHVTTTILEQNLNNLANKPSPKKSI